MKNKKTKSKETRAEKYLRLNPKVKELYVVNENLIYTDKEKAEKSKNNFKTVTRNGKGNK